MKDPQKNTLVEIIRKHEAEILADWLREQAAIQTRRDQVHEAETRGISKDFLAAFVQALEAAPAADVRAEATPSVPLCWLFQ